MIGGLKYTWYHISNVSSQKLQNMTLQPLETSQGSSPKIAVEQNGLVESTNESRIIWYL